MRATIQGKAVELPKYTVSVEESFADADSKRTPREIADARFTVLEGLLGYEDTAQLADGGSADACDIAKLALAYSAVKAAYQSPVLKEQTARLKEQIAQLKPVLETVKQAQAVSAFKLVE